MQKVKCTHCGASFNADTSRVHTDLGKLKCAWCSKIMDDPGPDTEEEERRSVEAPDGTLVYVVCCRALGLAVTDTYLGSSLDYVRALARALTFETRQGAERAIEDAESLSSENHGDPFVRPAMIMEDGHRLMIVPDPEASSTVQERQPIVGMDVRFEVELNQPTGDDPSELVGRFYAILSGVLPTSRIEKEIGGTLRLQGIQLVVRETIASKVVGGGEPAPPVTPETNETTM